MSQRYAAQALHNDLLSAVVISPGIRRETFRQCDGRFRFHPAGRNTHDTDPLGRHLLRKTLAVSGECGLRGGVSRGAFGKWQHALYRCDMDNNATSLSDHRGQQSSIKTNRRHQVLVERLPPRGIVKRHEPTRRRCRTPNHVNDNVDRAELRKHRFGDQGTPFSCRKIGRDVMHTLDRLRWPRTSGRDDACAPVPKGFNDSRADTSCPARNQRAAVRELEI
jgi:hypothetical protein